MILLGIENGKEVIIGHDENSSSSQCNFITLPTGTIEKLTGKKNITKPIDFLQLIEKL